MPRGKLEKNIFGPSILTTIEVGDIFRNVRDHRVLRVTGKRYHADLSVSYLLTPIYGQQKIHLGERTFHSFGAGGWERIYTIPRTIICAEHIFTGAPHGSS